jgi:ComF family protein
MTFAQSAKTLLFQAIDAVLPPRCIVTGDEVAAQGTLSPRAWAALDFISDPYCRSCGMPFELAVGEEAQCASCLSDPPPFATARAALKYNDASRSIILGFKHADKTHAVISFMPWLMRAGQAMLADADFIVPVPLHPYRLINRRYNQSAIIAFELGRQASKPVIADALIRVRNTPTQGHLKATERADNVRKAFMINQDHRKEIAGKNIIITDDVYTTGATVKECTHTLLDAGAANVHVLTVSRVVKTG